MAQATQVEAITLSNFQKIHTPIQVDCLALDLWVSQLRHLRHKQIEILDLCCII